MFIGAILLAFPKVFYFMISFTFINDGIWSLLSINSAGYFKGGVEFLRFNILPWNNYLKIRLIINNFSLFSIRYIYQYKRVLSF